MKLLSCVFYKGYYFFLAYWFNEIIKSICKVCLDKPEVSDNSNSDEKFVLEEELLRLILLNISDLLSGFLVLYTNIKMKPLIKKKEKKDNKSIKSVDSSLIYNELYGDNHKYKFLLIVLISCIDFIFKSIDFLSAIPKIKRLKPRQTDWMLFIDIIVRHILCLKLLKIKIGRHHKLSVILYMIGFILMLHSDAISIMRSKIKTRDLIINIIIIFPKTILFPLEDTFNKIILTNNFLLPHSLLFLRGLFQFCLILIVIPLLLIKIEINSEFFKELKKPKKITYSILVSFLAAIRNLCLMNVIYIFNSSHISFLLSIVIFDNTIRQFCENNDIYNFKKVKGFIYFAIDIMALILIFLGSIIFNEMIIINAWRLNEKTRPGLLFLEKIENTDNLDSIYYADDDEREEVNKNNLNNRATQGTQKKDSNQNDNNGSDEESEEKEEKEEKDDSF